MPVYREYGDEPAAYREPVGNELTSYAIVKYAFILAIVIVVLFFLAKFVIPLVD